MAEEAAAVEDMEEMCRISRFRHRVSGTPSPPIRVTAIVEEEEEEVEVVAGTVDHQVVSVRLCAFILVHPADWVFGSQIFVLNAYSLDFVSLKCINLLSILYYLRIAVVQCLYDFCLSIRHLTE